MHTIIIDAYNLIYKIDELKILLSQDQDICVDTMIAKLQSHFYQKGYKVVLVFDGKGKNKHQENIEVKFSNTQMGNKYENADALIKVLIDKARTHKLVKVVSSDREVISYAKISGCKIQSGDSFWGDIKDQRIIRRDAYRESKEKPDHVTKGEVDYFLKEFNKK